MNAWRQDLFRHRSKRQLPNGSFKRFVPALQTTKMDYPGIYKIPKAPLTCEASHCSLLTNMFVCFFSYVCQTQFIFTLYGCSLLTNVCLFFQLCLSDPVHCYPLWMFVRDKLHECHSVYGQETFQHLMDCLDSAVATQLANFINH